MGDNRDLLFQNALDENGAYPVSNYFTPQAASLATARIHRVRENWDFYLGRQKEFHKMDPDREKRKTIHNYVRAIVNKSVRWVSNPAWRIVSQTGNEALAELFEGVWKRNQKELLLHHIAMQSSITGDAFVWVGLTGPKENQTLRIRALDSGQVHVVLNPEDTTQIVTAVIQYPIVLSTKSASAKKVKDRAKKFPQALFTMVVTRSRIEEYINDTKIADYPGLGYIPLVHIPNLLMGGSGLGQDEVTPVKSLNLSVNEVSTNLKTIIDYYAEPITLVYGHVLADIARGSGQIWSGLSQDARVESLEQKADLQGAATVLDGLTRSLHETSNIPLGSLSSEHPITNVSEAALRVYFMPLMEVIEEKQQILSDGVNRINKKILTICHKSLNVEILDTLEQNDENPLLRAETRAQFTSPIPKDVDEHITAIERKLRMKIMSQSQALRETNTDNFQQVAMDILSDMALEMYTQYQSGQAAMGNPTSYAGLAVGSLGKMSGAKKELESINKLLDNTEDAELLVDLLDRKTSESSVATEEISSNISELDDSIQQIDAMLNTKKFKPREKRMALSVARKKT